MSIIHNLLYRNFFPFAAWRGLFGEAKSKAVPAIRSAAKMASMASRSPSWKPSRIADSCNRFTMVYLSVLTPLKGINRMVNGSVIRRGKIML